MHPLKAIRHACVDVLRDAAISVTVQGAPKAVTIADHPPLSGLIDESKLPGIYCYVRSEKITAATRQTDDREMQIDFVLQGADYADDVLDQVDDMHLALEQAVTASGNLGALVYRLQPIGSDGIVERGEISFASRRVTYVAMRDVLRRDPTVSP